MNVIILAKFSTNLQKNCGAVTESTAKWSIHFFSVRVGGSFFWQRIFIILLITHSNGTDTWLCAFDMHQCPNLIYSIWRKKPRFFPLRMKLRNEIHFNVIRLSTFFRSYKQLFFLLNRKFAMSYTNTHTHTTSDVGPEKLRKRRISNHDETSLRIKPLTVKHREKPSKYCVNFSSLNKMYCEYQFDWLVYFTCHMKNSKQQWFPWSDCMK